LRLGGLRKMFDFVEAVTVDGAEFIEGELCLVG